MSCKVCYREYEDRPNDICDNYLHWQGYVYQLEDNKVISRSTFVKRKSVSILHLEIDR
jgi:hypothetical protein